MRSTNDAFDQDVKRVLHEAHSEDIPIDYLEDIEKRLDLLEKKKKRPLLAWFFMGLALAAGLTFTMLYGIGKSNPTGNLVSNKIGIKKMSNARINAEQNGRTDINRDESNVPHLSSDEDPTLKGDSPKKQMFPLHELPSKKEMNPISRTKEEPLNVFNSIRDSGTAFDLNLVSSDQIQLVSSAFDSTHANSALRDSIKAESSIIPQVSPVLEAKIVVPKWARTIGFFAGMSGVLSSFHTNDAAMLALVGSNAQKYREIRTAQERATSSIDLSIRYRMVNEHLILQTGLDFFEWGEQVQYDYSFNYDGVNRYSYLSLPVYLGYRRAFQNVEMGANFGCSIGHVLQQKGQYIHPDLVTLSMENARTWVCTGLAQFEFIYCVDRYRFTLAPTYRMSIGNVVNSTFTKNRYYSIGLQMGMAYQF